ncbi:hypothetical protein KI387_041109 [Taxus chinensis]|uniref:Pentatricopeptide repeat-containing protein n=1 Tax=Taxus chinensis TaxID=29808 RepID=A0AA38CCE5_TAXCH|nr:hypothetical protein KI387_041109 [Taxus chinensis]
MWRSKAGLIFRKVSSAINTSSTCAGTTRVQVAAIKHPNQVISAKPICLYSSAPLCVENFVNPNDSNEEHYGSYKPQIENIVTPGNFEYRDNPKKCKEYAEEDVEKVVRILKKEWEVQELEAELQTLDLNLNSKMIGQVFKTPDIESEQFVSFFRWALKQPEYVPSSGVMNAITTTICCKGRGEGLGLLRNLFREVAENHKGVVTTTALDTFIDRLWRSKREKEALEVFQQFDEFECKRGPKSYLLTFSGICMASMFDEAFAVLEEMKKAGYFPGNVGSAASKIIKELCKSKRPKEAHMIYLKLIENGTFPGIAALISLVDSLCKVAATPDVASEILGTIPSRERVNALKAYFTVIRTFCHNHQIEEAKAILSEMVEIGPRPDHATYNAVVTALCKAEEPEEAMPLLEQMSSRRLKPDVYAYNVIMASFSRAGKMQEACDVFLKAKQAFRKTSLITYKILIDGFCRSGDPKKAYQYFSELKKSGFSLNRDIYIKLISVHAIQGLDWHRAEELLREMKKKGFRPSLHTQSLVDATKKLKEEALQAEAGQVQA